MNIEKSPLLFYLGLLDTIEPLKIIKNNDEFVSNILESMCIYVKDKNIIIKYDNELKNYIKFNTWVDKIKSIKKWLDVDVDIKNEIIIKVK